MVKCLQCGLDLTADHQQNLIASISGEMMGDEYTETYFLCPVCGVYTMELYHDRFLDEENISFHGPFSRVEGDEKVALIRKCPDPWNKKCTCAAHKTYFS